MKSDHSLDRTDIAVLLWHAENGDETHPEEDSVDYRASVSSLRGYELLSDSNMDLTLQGEKFVEMLLATPLPVQRWVDPR